MYTLGLGNISINRQYCEPMMCNNQYRRFFKEAIISHLQCIAIYRSDLQQCYNNAMSHNMNNRAHVTRTTLIHTVDGWMDGWVGVVFVT